MNTKKLLKILGTGCQILGAIGGIVMAGFEISDGIGKLNEFKNAEEINDSAAPSIEVEA